MTEIDVLVKGALLHDIGKVCLRADHSLGNHSEAGVKFLSRFLGNAEDEQQLLRCVQLHHSSALRNARISSNDLSYIVYEADNIAAAADRREEEGADKGFDAQACLQSVFNIFGEKQSVSKGKYHLRGMNPQERFNYPCVDDKLVASDYKYQELVDDFTTNFAKGSVLSMSNNELLRILEDIMSFVPSSTNKGEVCDISLYIHSKITAAIASCMYQYFAAQGITNYKEYCYVKNAEFRKAEAYLLVSGDFSGIQNFIYTIPSKGALKSLRGRSFYLEVSMENFIDEILAELHLSRANLLYTGGGHFYLLAANTEQTKAALQKLQAACNTWLLENFGTQLYMAMGYAACSAEVLQNSGAQRSVFAAVSRELNKDKQCRYDADNLAKLFDSESVYNKNLDGSRECSICHMSSRRLISDEHGDICPACRGLYDFGQKLFAPRVVFAVLDTEAAGSLELFGYNKKSYLAVLSKQELEKYRENLLRVYSKNEALTGGRIGTRLWLADYLYRDDKGAVLTFENLTKESHGINRLGVLRADVDNLGAAFIGGFVRYGQAEAEKYATLSRYADLSRDLGLFFKLAVGKICRGELNGFDNAEQKPFSLFGVKKELARKVHVVYSGGDDMFIVGAWDELLELAVDIRRAFARFTQDKLKFSAGLALFSAGYPISKMAEITGMLESAAKQNDKNSIALFGFDTEQHDGENEICCQHVYHWREFTDRVCAEKLQFLRQHLDLDDNVKDTKLAAGIALLYRLLNLLDEADKEDINLARFAYTLGRMQPEKGSSEAKKQCYDAFSEQMYQWFKSPDDRKQLRTALNLIIYYHREAKEE